MRERRDGETGRWGDGAKPHPSPARPVAERSQFRGFVALPLPAAMRQQAAAVIDRLRGDSLLPVGEGRGGGVRWTASENLHLTLKFLGQVSLAGLPELTARLAEAAREVDPFAFAVGGLGAFPRPERPQVIWIGITEGAAELQALAARVEAACARVGFAPEERPFHAHITLGRARTDRSGRTSPGLPQALRAAGPVALGRARAERFHLMKSDRTPRGPLYTVMATFELGKEHPLG